MKMFSANWDDDADLHDDGPMFGASERFEKRKQIRERAKEIDSGLSLGTFDRDEKVWDEVKKIKEEK